MAATDYVRAVPQMIASYLPGRRLIVLGTDGFGRSDTRMALRDFFEVDRSAIALAAVQALVDTGQLSPAAQREAIDKLGDASEAAVSPPPWQR